MNKYLEMLGGDEEAQKKLMALDKNDKSGAITTSIDATKAIIINTFLAVDIYSSPYRYVIITLLFIL